MVSIVKETCPLLTRIFQSLMYDVNGLIDWLRLLGTYPIFWSFKSKRTALESYGLDGSNSIFISDSSGTSKVHANVPAATNDISTTPGRNETSFKSFSLPLHLGHCVVKGLKDYLAYQVGMEVLSDAIAAKITANIEDDTIVYVDAFGLLGKPVKVKITHGKLMGLIEQISNDEEEDTIRLHQQLFGKLLDVNVDKLVRRLNSREKDALDEWNNFCSDILIIHACRFTLHGKPIPITPDVGKDIPVSWELAEG